MKTLTAKLQMEEQETLQEVLMADGLDVNRARALIKDYHLKRIGRLADRNMKSPKGQQLSLFPQVFQESPPYDLILLQDEERLQSLLQEDLGFKGQSTTYATHSIHAFAAKFPPQLPRLFIEGLTHPGEVVLDPMVGSGTTLVETLLLGRVGIGFDLDPLASLISRVKITRIKPGEIQTAGEAVLRGALEALRSPSFKAEEELEKRYSKKVIKFLHYWFTVETRRELLALFQEVERCSSLPIQNLLITIFSSIIITKSGGVSLARDLAHSRPHKDPGKQPKSALEAFREKLYKILPVYKVIAQAPGRAFAFQGDARDLPMKEDTVDLIVTSPPYANAIDYIRAHKFSLFWLGYEKELLKLRQETIGAEVQEKGYIPPSPTIGRVIEVLKDKDPRKAGILANYFQSMEGALREMYRVLRPGKAAIIVVGPSTTRGINIPTQIGLAEIGEAVGFKCIGIKEREIDRDKRMMPWSQARGEEGIEARIHEEHVIALMKPQTEGA